MSNNNSYCVVFFNYCFFNLVLYFDIVTQPLDKYIFILVGVLFSVLFCLLIFFYFEEKRWFGGKRISEYIYIYAIAFV